MIKQLTRRFVDWMEHAPVYQTIWFVPILVVIGLIALTINALKGNRS